jgi:hypothetical protein
MSRLLEQTAGLETFHQSFRSLLAQLQLQRCVIFSRVSQKVRNDNSGHTPALSTQADFCSRFCPPEISVETLECESVSASDDGCQIAARLSQIRDSLVIASSVERICRTSQGFSKIEELCERNNIAIVILVWPPVAILNLSLASQDPSNFLEDHVLERLYNLQLLSRQTRSLPSLFPTLIACKTSPTTQINVHTRKAVHDRISASESYLRGLSASKYQGSNQIQLPPELTQSRWKIKDFPKHMTNAIRTCLPDTEVIFGSFEMVYNTECHCSLWEQDVNELQEVNSVVLGCQEECRCTCEVCERNQRFVCGLTKRDAFCGCTCKGHHSGTGCEH